MSAKRRHLLFALPVLLAGCNTPVRETRLKAVDERTALQWRSFVDERLRGQIGLGSIKGSDPEAVGYLQKTLQWTWRSRLDERTVSDALEEQLRLLRLFASLPGSGGSKVMRSSARRASSPLTIRRPRRGTVRTR